MLISKFIGYVLIHLLNLGVPSAHFLKTSIVASHFQIGTCKINKETPGGMQGSNFIQLVSLSNPCFYRATSKHDMI